ncbi:MAG: hypothetical protein C0614_08950 [Desulfuromonas sp.]|nr:MAG: hypothetical protein C0614_08950 [Desulfuromonas sp.]
MPLTDYTLDTNGYRQATVSIFGTAENLIDQKGCRVGVVMLPREMSVVEAWKKDRFLALAEEINASVSRTDKYFQGQIDIDIKFPSYILGFYNTCSSKVTLNLYSYLK